MRILDFLHAMESKPWHRNPTTKAVYLHLAVTACTSETAVGEVTLKAGQVMTSESELLKAIDATRGALRWSLKQLADSGDISRQSTARYSIITIRDYAKLTEYDSEEKTKHTEVKKWYEEGYAGIPTYPEVCALAEEMQSPVNVYRFFNYYAAVGWRTQGSDIFNWRSLFRIWDDSERTKTELKQSKTNGIIRPNFQRSISASDIGQELS